ncbi:MAG: GH3 auxin-responsive promoter family protein [Planctomycetota bacterium]
MARRSWCNSLLGRAAMWHAGRIARRFFHAAEHATATQDELLSRLIARNADSGFGRDHYFHRIRTYDDFAANVPIRSYDDMAPYINRVRNGDVGALFGGPQTILMFALTSGTTAEPKYIPVTRDVLAEWRRGWNVWGFKALLDHPACVVRHIVQVTSPMEDHLAPSGAPCGAITGLLATTQKKLVRRFYTSPLAVAGITDSAAKYYTIMRMAIPKDVAWLVTANPSTLLVLARTADEHREQMIRDIHDGALRADMPVESAVRAALAPTLKPDSACASRLERIVREHGTLYPKHYWDVGFLAHWTGGTMGLYLPQFPKYFGDVPARDIGLIASEGRMSVPMEDGTPGGILAITGQFFEFVPAEEYGTPNPTVLRSDEVEEGREYFLLLTNASGLYRYDVGDRVRVTGRAGQAPVIEFLSRDAHTSSMAGEKLTEDQVVAAMRRACEAADGAAGGAVVDFVLAPRWAEVPRYRLYVERESAQRVDHLAPKLDKALSEISLEYASKRKTLRLEGVELAELPPGCLADRDCKLREQRSRTSEQFKHQYLLSKPGMDADLERRSVPHAH